MYIAAAKAYLKEIKPVLEEAVKTGKDLAVKDFDCKFDASLDCTIENGIFKMKVDYTGDSVTSFNLKYKVFEGRLYSDTIDELARDIDDGLSWLNEKYSSNNWRRY